MLIIINGAAHSNGIIISFIIIIIVIIIITIINSIVIIIIIIINKLSLISLLKCIIFFTKHGYYLTRIHLSASLTCVNINQVSRDTLKCFKTKAR